MLAGYTRKSKEETAMKLLALLCLVLLSQAVFGNPGDYTDVRGRLRHSDGSYELPAEAAAAAKEAAKQAAAQAEFDRYKKQVLEKASQEEAAGTHDAYCRNLNIVFMRASSFRDQGLTPQQAYASLFIRKDGKYFNFAEDKFISSDMVRNVAPLISDSTLKQIINEIYFSPDFRDIPGAQLSNSVFHYCMGYVKPITPLQ
ncbi:MAG: hypothetical protein ACYCZH_06985 [Sulfuriferula sp.]